MAKCAPAPAAIENYPRSHSVRGSVRVSTASEQRGGNVNVSDGQRTATTSAPSNAPASVHPLLSSTTANTAVSTPRPSGGRPGCRFDARGGTLSSWRQNSSASGSAAESPTSSASVDPQRLRERSAGSASTPNVAFTVLARPVCESVLGPLPALVSAGPQTPQPSAPRSGSAGGFGASPIPKQHAAKASGTRNGAGLDSWVPTSGPSACATCTASWSASGADASTARLPSPQASTISSLWSVVAVTPSGTLYGRVRRATSPRGRSSSSSTASGAWFASGSSLAASRHRRPTGNGSAVPARAA